MKKIVYFGILCFFFINLVGCSKEITITFIQENQEDIVRVINRGDELIDIPTPIEVKGFNTSWSIIDFSNIKTDTTVYAIDELREYTITYNLDGGVNSGFNKTTYTMEDCPFEINNPAVKSGYEFLGWYKGDDLDSGEVGVITVDELADLEVYAIFMQETEGLNYVLENDNTTYTVTSYSGTSNIVVIPKLHEGVSVTKIGLGAFVNSTITKVFIGSNVLSIENGAFSTCIALTHVKLNNGLITIKDGVFFGCVNLETLKLPSSLRNIGSNTLTESSIISITIPASVTSISTTAFANMPDLVSAYIYANILETPENMFTNCVNLETVEFHNNLAVLNHFSFGSCAKLKTVILPNTLEEIDEAAFFSCSGLESISLPNGLERIADGAFYRCNGLKEIIVPNSVISIGRYAFADCDSLEKISIPFVGASRDALPADAIFGYAFSSQTMYANMDSPASIKEVIITDASYIAQAAFAGCQNIKKIVLEEGVESIGINAFASCNALEEIILPNTLLNIYDYAFSSCVNLASVNMPTSVIHIGDYAFAGCTSLTTFTIPPQVINISQGIFWNCTALEAVVLHTNVRVLESGCFAICNSLNSITIPSSVVTIESAAFASCTALEKIYLPLGITTMQEMVFANCYDLTVYVKESILPGSWNTSWHGDASVVYGYGD